jgi:hypothetical protein
MAKARVTDPRSAKDYGHVAEVIGDAATMKLCEHFGGVRLYVPRHIAPNNPIALAIGKDAAEKLAQYYHGTDLNFPKAYLGRQRVVDMAQQGYRPREIALATGYTTRHVHHILKDDREDDGQLSFPGL